MKERRMITMKKTIALLLVSLTLFCAACALAEKPAMGGWTVAEHTEISEEEKAVFDQAMEGLLGVSYEPVAYLGHQLVAGRNHCFLCKATVVYPGAAPKLVLVYIYEDLNGGAKVTCITDLDIAALSVPAKPAE